MLTTRLAAIGIYPTATQAEVGVDTLIANGFNSAGIALMLPQQRNTRTTPGVQPGRRYSKRAAITAIGATGGAALLGALGVLAGSGAFAVPGISSVGSAGPLTAGVAGLVIGAAIGAAVGAICGSMAQEDHAKRLVTGTATGRTLLVIDCESSDEVEKAKAALARAGAVDVSASTDPNAPDLADAIRRA